jgi:hypothetical protein
LIALVNRQLGRYIIFMVKPIDIGLIQARRKKIAADIEAHHKALATLETENNELEIAERVFSKLSLGGNSRNNGDASKSASSASGKPAGLPAVSEMIKEALAHAVTLRARGMKPAAMLSYIRGKWWPAAQSKDVGPIAWRMWQDDQLEKSKEGVYALLKSERDAIREAIAKAATTSPPKPGEFDLTGKLNP